MKCRNEKERNGLLLLNGDLSAAIKAMIPHFDGINAPYLNADHTFGLLNL